MNITLPEIHLHKRGGKLATVAPAEFDRDWLRYLLCQWLRAVGLAYEAIEDGKRYQFVRAREFLDAVIDHLGYGVEIDCKRERLELVWLRGRIVDALSYENLEAAAFFYSQMKTELDYIWAQIPDEITEGLTGNETQKP